VTAKTFRDLEHEGWVARAVSYGDVFTKITGQAIDPILASVGNLPGKRLLDVACGPGDLTAAAARRGATCEGIDFAATLVELATARHPGITFREGDALQLPYPAGAFNAVVCSFGLLHVENSDRAIAEARRVLKQGGRYAFTVWGSPEQGHEFFKLVQGAIQRHGTPNVPLPRAPPLLRFAELDECRRTLTAAGFSSPAARIIALTWQATTAGDILALIYKSIVRMPMILELQTDDARERIPRAIVQGAEAYRKAGVIELKFAAVLATAAAA
jgi:SAM-dependent methyltransferase